MKIKVNQTESNSIYVDKDNLHIANGNSLLRIECNEVESKVNVLINIYSGFFNLNEYQKEILRYIMFNNGTKSYNEIINYMAKVINKCTTTIRRQLDELYTKHLLSVTAEHKVCIANRYYVDINNIEATAVIAIILNNGK